MVPVLLPEVTRHDLSAAKKQLRPVPEEKGRKRKLTMVLEPLHLDNQAPEKVRSRRFSYFKMDLDTLV